MIEAGIYQLLLNDPTLAGYVSNRVYGVMMPKNPKLPAVVFTIVGGGSIDSMEGENDLQNTRVQFDCYAHDFMTSRRMSSAIRDIFKGWRGQFPVSLPDGTIIQASHIHMDQDFPFELGGGAEYVFRALLDVEFYFAEQ